MTGVQTCALPIYLVGTIAVLLIIGAFVAGSGGVFKLISALKFTLFGWKKTLTLLTLLAALTAGLLASWLVRMVLGLIISRSHGPLGQWYGYMGARYRARLKDHRVWMVGIGLGSLVITLALFTMIPLQPFPDVNSDFALINIETVPGTTLAQTEVIADQVAGIVAQRTEVDHALERIREGNARLFVTLKPDRKLSSQELSRELTPLLQTVADARVSFQDLSGPGGGGGGTGRPISIMLSGSNSQLLEQTANQLVEQMRGVKELVAPRIAADMRRPEVIITPRLDLAASLGVTTTALSQTIRIATIGDIDQNAAKFSLNDRQIPIRVRLSEASRRNISTLRNMPVPTTTGGSVPLATVADISFGSGPVSIQRYNQNRRVFVGADLAPDVLQGNAMALINTLPVMEKLPAGVSNAPIGNDKILQELLSNFAKALVAGVLLVFSVLVLLYHRFVSPLVNMGSLFLAPLGGLLLLLIAGQPISMPVFIGILMLFGIVAKNSILLIDFAIEEMAHGADKFDAIIEAGHKRAQPIVMTTVAMTAGMVPTAISLSGDSAWRAPMGTVVIGGLILSTLLTLLIVPAGFSLSDGLEKRLGPWLRGKLLNPDNKQAGVIDTRPAYPEAFPAE